ncbi:MAG: hypothetical protein IPP37_03200, partial [Saprospiraceae bacterium]|nr:hypothetical protein [Saprospiraceae bacterium]
AIDKVKAGGLSLIFSRHNCLKNKKKRKRKGREKEGQANADAGREEAGKKPMKRTEEEESQERKKKNGKSTWPRLLAQKKKQYFFAFSMANAKPSDFLKSIRAMKKAGLSEKSGPWCPDYNTCLRILQIAGQYGTAKR